MSHDTEWCCDAERSKSEAGVLEFEDTEENQVGWFGSTQANPTPQRSAEQRRARARKKKLEAQAVARLKAAERAMLLARIDAADTITQPIDETIYRCKIHQPGVAFRLTPNTHDKVPLASHQTLAHCMLRWMMVVGLNSLNASLWMLWRMGPA